MKDELKNGKDKVIGMVKQTTGEILDNQELEFKGKLQSLKADIVDKVEDVKEDVLEKANDFIDNVKNKKQE